MHIAGFTTRLKGKVGTRDFSLHRNINSKNKKKKEEVGGGGVGGKE